MPEILTIPQLRAMENEFPIPATKLKIKSVQKVHASKPADAKQWKFQEAVGTDGNNEIAIKFYACDDFPTSAVGKWYMFEATKGARGWSGVKIRDDEYNGKTTRYVWVTKKGVVTCMSDGAASPKPAPATSTQPKSALKAPIGHSVPANGTGNGSSNAQMRKNILEAKRVAMRNANWMLICLDATNYVADQFTEKYQVALPAAQLQAIASSFFISGQRSGTEQGLPHGPMGKYLEPAKAETKEPEPEPEPTQPTVEEDDSSLPM